MSDSDNKLNDLASQYLDLWQKQLASQSSEKIVEDAMKTAGEFQNQSQEMMKQLDTPEKMQAWMAQWADSWKAQFSDGTGIHPNGTASSSDTSGNAKHNVDELTRRITLLEERVRELESRFKN